MDSQRVIENSICFTITSSCKNVINYDSVIFLPHYNENVKISISYTRPQQSYTYEAAKNTRDIIIDSTRKTVVSVKHATKPKKGGS